MTNSRFFILWLLFVLAAIALGAQALANCLAPLARVQ